MKILFMDDEEWRHNTLRDHVGTSHEMWHVYGAEDAIAAIEEARNDSKPFDVISLDHDLGSGKKEGRLVSQYLKTISFVWPMVNLPQIVIVHSWNAPAAQMMIADLLDGQLQDVVLAPFKTFNYKVIGFGWPKNLVMTGNS